MSQFDLAAAVRGTVAAAETAAAEISAERTIETITGEILDLKSQAGEAIIQIGERLIEAKELLPHGAWLPWLAEEVEFSERTAQNFMRLAREWRNPQALADLGKEKALKLLILPVEEREAFLQEHDVVDMTSRELEHAIRERDEAKRAAEQAALDLEDANAKIKQLESAPKEVYRDEDAIAKAEADAKKAAESEWKKQIGVLEAKLKAAESRAEDAVAESAEVVRLRAELDAARAAQTKAAVSGDADLAAFELLFESAQEQINKMHGLLLKVRGRGDEELAGKLARALGALADKVRGCAE